jgi:hypothetical protein
VEAEIIVAVPAVAARMLVPDTLHRTGHKAKIGKFVERKIDAAGEVGNRLERYPITPRSCSASTSLDCARTCTGFRGTRVHPASSIACDQEDLVSK